MKNKMHTVVAICMAVLANALLADTNLTETVVLSEDTDWRSLGTVTIPEGVGIHLNGHNLSVRSFDGAGSIYAARIPLDYVELEYVQTDGNQYIDTGVSPLSASEDAVKVDADIAFTGSTASTYAPLISASLLDNSSTRDARCYGVWVWNGNWAMHYGGEPINASSAAVSVNSRTRIVAAWRKSAQTLHVDGVQKASTSSALAYTTANTMYLPAYNRGGSVGERGKFRLYSFKIYQGSSETLVRDYVPVRRKSDNAVGLYDCKNNTFSPSATETPFIAGEDVVGPAQGGELHIDVASGIAFTNSTVAISNGVKVVKEGAGRYISKKSQRYSGGTLVSAGRVAIGGINSPSDVLRGFGISGSDVVVASNAQVVINGFFQTLSGYNVTIAGDGPDGNGAIFSHTKQFGQYDSPFLKSLTLAGDASIKVAARDSFNLCSGTNTIDISLCGHRLTANGSARLIVKGANVLDAGRIVSAIAPGGNPTENNFYVTGAEMAAPLVDFEVAQGGALGGDGSESIVVSNMTFAGTWAPASDTKSVTVLGRYLPKPTAVNWPKLVLGDPEHLSPTLDLSALSSAYNGTNLSFAVGATVAVRIGNRKVPSGTRLVSWTAEPANRFVRGDSDAGVGFEKKSDGLYFAHKGLVIFVQ